MINSIAILDACVLYPAPLRDLLITLAHDEFYQAKWTDKIHQEWSDNLLNNRPDLKKENLQNTINSMNDAILDCLVTGFESLDIRWNKNFGNEEAKPFAENYQSDSLNLSGCRVGNKGAIALARSQKFPNLNLSCNKINKKATAALALNSHYTSLDLSCNGRIGSLSAIALAQSESKGVLNVEHCDIGLDGFRALAMNKTFALIKTRYDDYFEIFNSEERSRLNKLYKQASKIERKDFLRKKLLTHFFLTVSVQEENKEEGFKETQVYKSFTS